MIILLTILSALAVLVFVGVLVYFLMRIVRTLERIGGAPNSYLAQVNFGVRAIAQQTSHLGPQVTQLNQGLASLGEGLGVVNRHLQEVAQALGSTREGAS